MSADCSATTIAKTSGLSRRADSLRGQADGLRPLVAQAYRRRASELELEAWAIKARNCRLEPIAA